MSECGVKNAYWKFNPGGFLRSFGSYLNTSVIITGTLLHGLLLIVFLGCVYVHRRSVENENMSDLEETLYAENEVYGGDKNACPDKNSNIIFSL